eukprot:Nk52_evm1s2428 gene=Nk52_evmTU1s2428
MRGVEQFRVVPVLLVLLICLHVGVSALPQTATSSGNSSEGEIFEELAVTGKNNSTGDIATKAFEFYSKVTSFLYSCLWIKIGDLMAKNEFLPKERKRRGQLIDLFRNCFRSQNGDQRPQRQQTDDEQFKAQLKDINTKMINDVKKLQKTGQLSDSLKQLIPKELQNKFVEAIGTDKDGRGRLASTVFAEDFATYLNGLIEIRGQFLQEYRQAGEKVRPGMDYLDLFIGIPDSPFMQAMLLGNAESSRIISQYKSEILPKIDQLRKKVESKIDSDFWDQPGLNGGPTHSLREPLLPEIQERAMYELNTDVENYSQPRSKNRGSFQDFIYETMDQLRRPYANQEDGAPQLSDNGGQGGQPVEGNGDGDGNFHTAHDEPNREAEDPGNTFEPEIGLPL